MPERNGHLLEEDARTKISEALDQLRTDRSLGTETKAGDDNASVEYHLDNILKAGGGVWNETIAKDYITNLRAQVGQELEAPETL
jgi:hypothetical protein